MMLWTNGRCDDDGPEMLETNDVSGCSHVTGSTNHRRGMLLGMLGWAGHGDVSQSQRSSSHHIPGENCDCDCDTHVRRV